MQDVTLSILKTKKVNQKLIVLPGVYCFIQIESKLFRTPKVSNKLA